MTHSDVTRIVVYMLLGCVVAATASPALAQFTADGRLDEEALLVPTVIDGRIGYAAFVVDTSPEGGDPGVDGFRDGPFSPTLIPPCAVCVDAVNGRARTPFGTGQLTVIYLMDSDGVVDYTDPSSDDSVLYVGMDIANGDPRMVGGHLIDIQDLSGPGLCDDGTPDLNNDGQANVFMIPFDADGNGDASTVTRFNEEGDPNCQIEISPVTGDLTSETYELEVFACGGDRGLKLSGDRLFLFRLTMEEGVGQDVVELKVFKDVDHLCTDFNVAEVTGSHEGLTAAQLTALGQDPDFGRDIEFVIKRIDSLVVTAHGTYPGCTEFPDYREVRFALGEGGVSTLSGAIGDLSEEDVIEAPFTIVAPEIEVTKGVRCAGDTGRLVAAQALPESTVEFVIEVENTGNVDLAVTLDDVLQEFGLATATVDETYLSATLYRPADGSGIVETIAFDNAGDYGLNPTFFVPGGSGSPGFLGGVIDGAARYMGVLQGVSACPMYVPGDKMELVFRVRVDAPEECDGQIDPDIRNKIAAVGDPDIPPVADGDEVTDAPGNVPLDELAGVDTYREMYVNSPASDDNVADVQILCRKLTFEKEVRYVADCENPPACDDDTDFSDTAIIPQEATLPICIQYRYTITNDGEVDELIDLSEEFLAGDIGPGVEFDCTLPLVLNDVVLSAGGGHVQVCCVLKFATEEALDDFLTFDDARECNAIQPPGYDDPGCYSNCAKVTADVTSLEGICNGVPPLELYDYATFCDGRCTGRIGDFVWYDGSEAECNGCQEPGEQGIPNVTVVLKDSSGTVIATDVTDADGYYLFTGLCAGDYTVEVDESTLPDGYYASPSQQDCADPSTANDSNGSPADVTLTTDHSEDLTIDFGYCTPCDGRIGDFVWLDGGGADCNGCQEDGEQGIPGVTVILKDASGAVIATTVTDADGYYLFTGLCAGDYTVEIDDGTLPPGVVPAPCTNPECADPAQANDNNCSPADVTLTEDDSEDLTIDFGYCSEGQCDLVLEKRGCVIVPGTCVPTVWISATPAEGGEGCSHGYWKNHTGNWPDPYSPWSDFDATFGVNVFNPNKSLYRALGLTGGGVNALAREATAALLNAASAGVDYSLSVSEVIAMVQGAVAPGGDVEGTKDTLEFFNTQNCPFDRCEEPCLLQVTFGASDNCGEPTVTGVIDIGCQEIPVTSGQIVQVQCDTSGCEYQWMGNILVIESPQAVLNVTASGADCGTPQTCSLDLCDVNCDAGGSQECVGSGSCDGCEPSISISATPTGRDGGNDGGRCWCRLRVNYSATDNCGDATTSAYIDIGCDQIPVSDGQIVEYVCDTGKCDCWYYWDHGVLRIVSYQIVVHVTAEGECGTPKTCTLDLCALNCSQGGSTECPGGGDCNGGGGGGDCITAVPCEMSAGADVEYTYAVTNNSAGPVTDVEVIDDMLGEVPGSPIASIAAGETVTLTAIGFVTEETTNTATATGWLGDIQCEASDSATITFEDCDECDLVVDKRGCVVMPDECEPTVWISATPSRDDGGRCGCRLRVNYGASDNCGDATLSAYIDIGCHLIPISDGQVVDFVCDTGKCDCWYYWDAGVLHIYSYQIVVYVTAEGECGTPKTCSLNLCALDCSQGGGTECTGGGNCGNGGECITEVPCEMSAGADVEYTYAITNNGDQAVTDVSVIDDVLGEIPGSPIPSIGPGETVTLSAIDFVTEETTNTVTVAGYVGQILCRASDTATITFEPCPGGQGCTPGYWKNHLWAWPSAYQPCDDFDATFGVDAFDPDITLNQAVWLGGGGVDALGRHAVAALLNAASAGVDYGMSVEQVIAAVQQALAPGGDVEGTKDLLESFNEQGCPLSGSIPTGVLGDVNCDGVINMFDVDLFAVALASATDDPPFGDYFARDPACNPMRADMDQNGVVDLFDVEPFVELLTAD